MGIASLNPSYGPKTARFLSLPALFFMSSAILADELKMGFTHSCDDAMYLGVHIRNDAKEEMRIPNAYLPERSENAFFEVRVFEKNGNRYARSNKIFVPLEVPGAKTYEPGGRKYFRINLLDSFPDASQSVGKKNIFVEIVPRPYIKIGEQEITVQSRAFGIFFPREKSNVASPCPILLLR